MVRHQHSASHMYRFTVDIAVKLSYVQYNIAMKQRWATITSSVNLHSNRSEWYRWEPWLQKQNNSSMYVENACELFATNSLFITNQPDVFGGRNPHRHNFHESYVRFSAKNGEYEDYVWSVWCYSSNFFRFWASFKADLWWNQSL